VETNRLIAMHPDEDTDDGVVIVVAKDYRNALHHTPGLKIFRAWK